MGGVMVDEIATQLSQLQLRGEKCSAIPPSRVNHTSPDKNQTLQCSVVSQPAVHHSSQRAASKTPTIPAQWAVLDTNQLLDYCDSIQYMIANIPGVNFIVPLIVLRELESLQHGSDTSQDNGLAARNALRYMQSTMLSSCGQRCNSGSERSRLNLQKQVEISLD